MARNGRRCLNVVPTVADDLGYADLGCYGQQEVATPHFDALAGEGARFTQAYAGCTVCAPSRTVLMTGLHGGRTPVRSITGGVPLPAEVHTLTQVLQGAGYVTGGFG